MKKSIKKFLIISQALGWSALVASACTEEQVKNTIQNTITDSKSKDSTNATASDPSTQNTNGDQKSTNENPQKPNGKAAPSASEKDGKNMKSDKSQETEHLNKDNQPGGATGHGEAHGKKTPEEMKKTEESQTQGQDVHTTGGKPGPMTRTGTPSNSEAKMHTTDGEAGKNGNKGDSQTSQVEGEGASSTHPTGSGGHGGPTVSESPTDSEHDSGSSSAAKVNK